jgi:hypothetical protein
MAATSFAEGCIVHNFGMFRLPDDAPACLRRCDGTLARRMSANQIAGRYIDQMCATSAADWVAGGSGDVEPLLWSDFLASDVGA